MAASAEPVPPESPPPTICKIPIGINAAGQREETDAMGSIEVPADRYWGAQTQRSIENFPIGVGRFAWTPPVIRAFGILKKCAALANGELGELPRSLFH